MGAILFAATPLLAQTGDTAAGESADLPLPEGAPRALWFIDQKGLKKHAFHFASDELGGRYTSTAGQLAAADYIAETFGELGLEPLGDEVDGERQWLQHYTVAKTYLADTSKLTFGDSGFDRHFGVIDGRESHAADVTGQLVWCGYGKPEDLPDEELAAGDIPVVAVRTARGAGANVNA